MALGVVVHVGGRPAAGRASPMGTRAGSAVVIVESTLRTRHVQILGRAVEPGQGSGDGRSTDTEHARDRRDALVL